MLRFFFVRLVFHILRLAFRVLRLGFRVLRLVFRVLGLDAGLEELCNRGKMQSEASPGTNFSRRRRRRSSRGSAFTSLGQRDSCSGTTLVISGTATRGRGIIFSLGSARAAVR